MSYVTGISGNVISAASAGWAPTNSAEVSAIASAYATGSEQVVTSLQYATSESATVADTVTANTAIGYGARDMSAECLDYGTWAAYDSSTPLIKVRMTSDGTMRNYSSYPYYLYMVPYGATNYGNVSNTGALTGARGYGEFSGDMDDFIIAQGTGSAYSQNPSYVEVTFNVTHVPFIGSQPAFWGTVTDVPGRYVVDSDENSKPVFCVAGGYDGYELFEVRSYTTAELDFGTLVTASAVSGINELDIYTTGGGGIDSATVSAIASSYARDVSAAASGAVSAVSSNSANWLKLSSFSGVDGIVTAVGSSYGFDVSASAFMGIDSALKGTTGTISGSEPFIYYLAQLPDGVSNAVILSAVDVTDDTVDVYYKDYNNYTLSVSLDSNLRQKAIITNASGILSAMSRNRAFQIGFTAKQPEALAFQSDLTGAGVDSATVSAIASAYAESAASSKLDTTAFNSGDFYTTANESGYVDSAYVDSAVSGKADSSALSSYVPYSSLEYNTASAISGINGSALAAGSTYSAGEGIDITDDVISVETPVDVVAGPGITIDNPDGNTMRISCDSAYATVLYSGANVTSATLSDNVMNYEFVDFYLSDDTNQTLYLRMDTTRDPLRVGGWGGFGGVLNTSSNWFGIRYGVVSATANSAYSLVTDQMSFFMSGGFRYSGQSTYYSIFKVYGIHRTASAQ